MYSAKIIADSISETGKRLTTFEITFPRIVLAEFNTHRMLSRNSASSRAIPFDKQIQRIQENPFIPEQFPLNCKGMQPQTYVTKEELPYTHQTLVDYWIETRDLVIEQATYMKERILELFSKEVDEREEEDYRDYCNNRAKEIVNLPTREIHKQIVNRLLEPFMWHTVICTATEWDNFFKLRTNENAQYEIRRIADLMYEAYNFPRPEFEEDLILPKGIPYVAPTKELKVGEWHLPLVDFSDESEDWKQIDSYLRKPLDLKNPDSRLRDYSERFYDLAKKISVARCARVSYLTHDGKRDIEKDLELFEKLRTSGHWSPFEHVATPYFTKLEEHKMSDGLPAILAGLIDDKGNYRSGNFIGWKQFRKEFQDENCTYFRK